MMKVNIYILSLFISFLSFQGCSSISRQVSEAYNLVQCQYDYNSISNLSLGGINLSNGINIMNTAQLVSLLTGNNSSLPLNMTINLDVTNPNQQAASLHGLSYILKIDNVEFTRGELNQPLSVASGRTEILPLVIGVDLVSLMSGDAGNATLNIVKNFIGISNEKSNVSLQIRPAFRFGNRTISSPQYIPVNFSFGGN